MSSSAYDTIVALATPEGHGALGVVRVSGPGAHALAAAAAGEETEAFRARPARQARLVRILGAEGEPLDEAVLVAWTGPASYTGEDVVELSCHGGPETLRLVVQRLLALGGRPAEPGEFTRRAFVHGRMTLEQAEAVGALTSARSEAAAKAAARLLSGGLGQRVRAARDEVVDALARIELQLDFSEDEAEVYDRPGLSKRLSTLAGTLDGLAGQYAAGRHLRHGALVVLAGAPNAGKSTLLNHFAGYERAIVHERPGTTRDYLEVSLSWDGVPVRLVDTAGLHAASEEIEAEGVMRTRDMLAHADLAIWLVAPPSFSLPPGDLPPETRLMVVRSKSDLPEPDPQAFHVEQRISALTGAGTEELRAAVSGRLLAGYDPAEVLVLEERQAQLLSQAATALGRGSSLLESGESEEVVAEELRAALAALGEITGEVTAETLLNRIFSGFCIGK
jgi:tRNA modification GTPase